VVRASYDRFGYATPRLRAGDVRTLESAARRRAAAPQLHLEQFGLSRAYVVERAGDYLGWSEARCGMAR